eukprot:CAMPEP_0118643098 /NCGR_PEP_ID=MMETSP0785-20121206/6209_1 /TAXON_ID=91992 /ORGANISM="Bolidomonas pacifica, Strain CCMP 1866" /LENGTH=231 /DNA_ID=CAMNT_0006534737 /DNA_START=185 /DNA_END=877 /DNA_ORIENTATION=-
MYNDLDANDLDANDFSPPTLKTDGYEYVIGHLIGSGTFADVYKVKRLVKQIHTRHNGQHNDIQDNIQDNNKLKLNTNVKRVGQGPTDTGTQGVACASANDNGVDNDVDNGTNNGTNYNTNYNNDVYEDPVPYAVKVMRNQGYNKVQPLITVFTKQKDTPNQDSTEQDSSDSDTSLPPPPPSSYTLPPSTQPQTPPPEYLILRNLTHPNILQFHDIYLTPLNTWSYVFELCP